jgi:hypothetical protein
LYSTTNIVFYGLLAPRPTPKLEGHPLSAVRVCLFNIFTATLRIWRPSTLSATWGRAMSSWQRTYLIWGIYIYIYIYIYISSMYNTGYRICTALYLNLA